MDSGSTVLRSSDGGKVRAALPWRRSNARVVHGDTLGAFTSAARKYSPLRLTIISPWLSWHPNGHLASLIQHARRHEALITLITRFPRESKDGAALDLVRTLSRSRVICNDRLHAKVYVCEAGQGQGVAMVGSANITDGSRRLIEIGVLLRPYRGSRVLGELVDSAIHGVAALTDSFVLPPVRSRLSRRTVHVA